MWKLEGNIPDHLGEEFFQAAILIVAGLQSKIDFLRTLSYIFYKHEENILWPTFIRLNLGDVIHPEVQAKSN